MASVNKAIIVGNLGRDPEVRYTQSGTAMTTFSVATTDTWMDQSNERQERTEWHRVVAWGKLGETCGQYLSKGRQVYIEGRLQTRSYDDKEGIRRYTTEINAREVKFLGSRDGGMRSDQPAGGAPGNDFGAGAVAPDDDVPF